MPTRQYIGARYVPKFFYGTGGSAEWVANTQYEALTIVTRNGNSYTSRKPVPSNIGAPEDNAEYWVSTGIYNEQIEEYRQAVTDLGETVDSIDDRVDAIEDEITPDNECWIFISDSYAGTYGNSVGDNTTIWSELASKLGMGNRAYFCTYVAAGFVNDTGGTFLTNFQNDASTIASALDVNKVSKVIVVAGRNDYVGTEQTVLSAMATFDNYVKTTYPNAKRYYGYIADGNGTSAGTKAQQIMNSYFAFRRCNEFGGVYLSGVECGIHILNGLADDGIHPTAVGKKYIANAIYEALMTGSYVASYPNVSATVEARTGYSFNSGYAPVINQLVENNSLYLFSNQLQMGLNLTSTNFNRGSHEIVFADITSGYIKKPFGAISVPCVVEINDTNCIGKLTIVSDGSLKINFRVLENLTGVTALTITGYNSGDIWPLVYC